MKKITGLLVVLLFMSHALGQDTQNNESRSNEFGAHLGATTGMGLSYRHWFNRVGFQLTALPVKTDQLTFISAGITGLYTFKQAKYVRAFGYIGNHFFYTERKDDNLYPNNSIKYKKQYNIGFGPGFEFGSTVTFNLMFGYGLYDVLNKFYMYPTGEIGLYFKF